MSDDDLEFLAGLYGRWPAVGSPDHTRAMEILGIDPDSPVRQRPLEEYLGAAHARIADALALPAEPLDPRCAGCCSLDPNSGACGKLPSYRPAHCPRNRWV